MEQGAGSLLSRICGTHFSLVMCHNADGSAAWAAGISRQAMIQSHFCLRIIFDEFHRGPDKVSCSFPALATAGTGQFRSGPTPLTPGAARTFGRDACWRNQSLSTRISGKSGHCPDAAPIAFVCTGRLVGGNRKCSCRGAVPFNRGVHGETEDAEKNRIYQLSPPCSELRVLRWPPRTQRFQGPSCQERVRAEARRKCDLVLSSGTNLNRRDNRIRFLIPPWGRNTGDPKLI